MVLNGTLIFVISKTSQVVNTSSHQSEPYTSPIQGDYIQCEQK